MGRKLPWKTSSTPSGPERKTSVKSESPLPTPSRALHPGTPSAFRKKPRRERVIEAEDTTRSPSTSPPPEPPKERFMRPGLDHDDRYRIVEDEFVNMAHQFTLHIHASEYNRLKNLAKHQNADTIREIERPVVGAPTLLTRHRQEDVRRNAKQRKLLGNDANEKKDSPYVGSSLQGLMESPRKEHKWISTGLADTAATRASAGFNSQKISPLRLKQGSNSSSTKRRQISLGNDDETDDGDDLDPTTPSRTAATKAARTTHTPSPAMPRSTPRTLKSAMNTTSRSGSSVKRPTTAPGGSEARKITKSRDAQEHIDDDDPFGINKRRIQRQKSREQFRKTEEKTPSKSSLDDIPSFI
ncbi:hypothetical protein FOXG_08325 [Fusarium oxysporum f. sp. lycopersici 4287]|uniref:Uncharacterized protein n=2 Tax=Fusarium oxysporum TaxID=5507 RepID=A0A0J9V7W2_FUSO4|nr:hypothetical protein FOXG_08325 [Fusarium oxysporum f. sp. lycopersici 4287]XP_018245019.1 hypothetical protein FOXG_08325 [Fusarium oxysporum f. sp. lycopersici 4287]XP_018245020.1 hypothetical protein FOXG_08325 [Fusarium oxysporum f. sp. lycopersici 4287]XP_018245021.1 hypothetical protein FOXG_08325 [Fusarium oxysporum f. sp. lycopersici 4287]EXK31824.1 hypothetical protein FOMG_12248 [Fusarium oxysporum f. sp. melonis 26406]EXK31825.1 hypothetical protein FOMG_12248 [Fusarium oxysporum